MKTRVLLVLASSVTLLAAVLLVNTLRFTSRQVQAEPVRMVALDEDAAAGRLAHALRFQTVSYQDPGNVKGEESSPCIGIWTRPFRGCARLSPGR